MSQLKREAQMSDQVDVVNGQLTLILNDEEVTIEKYGESLRRLVNKKGHEIVLQNVSSAEFEKRNHKILIEVEDTFHQKHTGALHAFTNGSVQDE